MLHAKFHENRPAGSREEDFWRVFTIYGRSGHLGQVTQMPWTNFRSLYPRRLHIKFGFWSARRFQRRRFLKGFYHIWAWQPSWSSDQDAVNKLSFPLPKEAPHKIWLWSARRFQRRRCLKLWTTTDNDGQTDAGPWVYYKLTFEPSAQVS